MKKIISVAIVIFLLVSIPLTVYFVKIQQELTSNAAPSTTIFLNPSALTIQSNQDRKINIEINTGTNLIVSADIILSYDPKILQVSDISAGDFLQNTSQIQKLIDNTNGKVTYSIFTYSQNAKSGAGTIAILTIKGKADGSSNIAFDKLSSIYGLGEEQNVLITANSGNYTVSSNLALNITPASAADQSQSMADTSPTATPTSLPTSTPIPTPTDTPVLTPTTAQTNYNLISTPTLKPTDTPFPTPTSTVQLAVTNILSGSVITTNSPNIKGTSAPNAKIVITVYSTPVNGNTTADKNGNWSWTTTNSLTPGQHSAVITATDNQGNSTTTKVNFTIASTAPIASNIAAPGDSWSMIFILTIGAGNVLLGFFLLKRISL